jgi:hypothetical protein
MRDLSVTIKWYIIVTSCEVSQVWCRRPIWVLLISDLYFNIYRGANRWYIPLTMYSNIGNELQQRVCNKNIEYITTFHRRMKFNPSTFFSASCCHIKNDIFPFWKLIFLLWFVTISSNKTKLKIFPDCNQDAVCKTISQTVLKSAFRLHDSWLLKLCPTRRWSIKSPFLCGRKSTTGWPSCQKWKPRIYIRARQPDDGLMAWLLLVPVLRCWPPALYFAG